MDSNTVELSGIWVRLIFEPASSTKSGFVSGGQHRNALLTDLVKMGLRCPRQSCLRGLSCQKRVDLVAAWHGWGGAGAGD